MTRPATTIVIGMVTSAINASVAEMTNIIVTTKRIVIREPSSWLNVCWRLCETLSMSFVTRLRISPRGWRSK